MLRKAEGDAQTLESDLTLVTNALAATDNAFETSVMLGVVRPDHFDTTGVAFLGKLETLRSEQPVDDSIVTRDIGVSDATAQTVVLTTG